MVTSSRVSAGPTEVRGGPILTSATFRIVLRRLAGLRPTLHKFEKP